MSERLTELDDATIEWLASGREDDIERIHNHVAVLLAREVQAWRKGAPCADSMARALDAMLSDADRVWAETFGGDALGCYLAWRATVQP